MTEYHIKIEQTTTTFDHDITDKIDAWVKNEPAKMRLSYLKQLLKELGFKHIKISVVIEDIV
jgi:hypothetical protein